MCFFPVGNIIAAHDLKHSHFVDDTQLYMAVRPNASLTFKAVAGVWRMVSATNPSKTETAALFGSRAHREQADMASYRPISEWQAVSM